MLAGCRAEEPEDGRAEQSAPLVAAGDSVYSHADERVDLPRGRIYYTLTRHEWYARGEPLMHEGRAYRPGGMPMTASLTEMSKLGEFQGVEFYARQGESAATLYVPVFEGYWQRFRTDAPVVDTTSSGAPPPSLDSAAAR